MQAWAFPSYSFRGVVSSISSFMCLWQWDFSHQKWPCHRSSYILPASSYASVSWSVFCSCFVGFFSFCFNLLFLVSGFPDFLWGTVWGKKTSVVLLSSFRAAALGRGWGITAGLPAPVSEAVIGNAWFSTDSLLLGIAVEAGFIVRFKKQGIVAGLEGSVTCLFGGCLKFECSDW